MAAITPFKGIRYSREKIADLAQVVTPPYDVIDREAQERYYQRNPYNIIRLEYGKVSNDDSPANNRYTRAAADFSRWLEERVLQPEAEPALYLYEQEFFAAGRKRVRTGYICAVKLEPYENGVVLPHEETLPKHKADRLELMKACRANFSPIFGLYADPESQVTGALRRAAGQRRPDVSLTDEKGEEHRLWVIRDSEALQSAQQAMEDKKIFIADGHHRYETALNYRAVRSAGGSTGSEPYNYVMMTLVNLYDPGLVVLPTHRLIRNAGAADVASLIQSLSENFTLDQFALAPDKGNFQEFIQLMASRGADPACGRDHRHVFGIYLAGKLYLAALKKEDSLAAVMPPGKSRDWQGLDVSVLHHLIIERLLGIGPDLLAGGDHVTYTREEEGALGAVDSGEYQVALFMNPTLVEEVTEVAANGEKMPQKSTFFYPKLITGLVINSLD